jgi:hypothetical protein
MAAVGLLYGVDGQGPDRVDAQRIQLLAGYQSLFTGYHAIRAPSAPTQKLFRRRPHPY